MKRNVIRSIIIYSPSWALQFLIPYYYYFHLCYMLTCWNLIPTCNSFFTYKSLTVPWSWSSTSSISTSSRSRSTFIANRHNINRDYSCNTNDNICSCNYVSKIETGIAYHNNICLYSKRKNRKYDDINITTKTNGDTAADNNNTYNQYDQRSQKSKLTSNNVILPIEEDDDDDEVQVEEEEEEEFLVVQEKETYKFDDSICVGDYCEIPDDDYYYNMFTDDYGQNTDNSETNVIFSSIPDTTPFASILQATASSFFSSTNTTSTPIVISSGSNNTTNAATNIIKTITQKDQQLRAKRQVVQIIDTNTYIFPIITPIIAYYTYEDTAKIFNKLIILLNKGRNWYPVDGGAYQSIIISPAINGIVVPAISILFATLIANTFTTLRQRQFDIRTALNMEAADLRVLSTLLEVFPDSTEKNKCISYLLQYTSRLIGESQIGVNMNGIENKGSMDSELNGFLSIINQIVASSALSSSSLGNNKKNINNSKTITAPPPSIISEVYATVSRLNSQRSNRISSLQSTFPNLHYIILSTLGASICWSFLIETNQDVLIFLNALQLRILWMMLIGTMAALAGVCYDLSDPFRGSYQISNAVNQLYTIRESLRTSYCQKR